jgi:cobalt/nickel transport system permease protein
MIYMDKYAYASKLKGIKPGVKLAFSVLTLAVCLWVDLLPVSIAIILLMGYVTVRKGGTPCVVFFRLLLVPVVFLVTGVLTVAIGTSEEKSIFLLSIRISGIYAGVSPNGLFLASGLFFKALGAASCLYFLSLSTPLIDLLALLRRLKVPGLLVELMSLVYRFVFVLLETAQTMLQAQNSRLGYSSPAASIRSVVMLSSTLFIRAYKRSEALYTALEARGYNGELNVLEEK